MLPAGSLWGYLTGGILADDDFVAWRRLPGSGAVEFRRDKEGQMGRIARLAAVVASSALIAGVTQAQTERVQAGQLTCDISGGIGLIIGSQRALSCTFAPSVRGPIEFYAGTLTKFGVDIGVTTGGVMVWAVYAPTTRLAGALAGSYGGASAEATIGAGIGANVLIGGSNSTITLQPLSLQGQVGLNVAGGVAGIDLRWVR
jgi:hypothetical protein